MNWTKRIHYYIQEGRRFCEGLASSFLYFEANSVKVVVGSYDLTASSLDRTPQFLSCLQYLFG